MHLNGRINPAMAFKPELDGFDFSETSGPVEIVGQATVLMYLDLDLEDYRLEEPGLEVVSEAGDSGTLNAGTLDPVDTSGDDMASSSAEETEKRGLRRPKRIEWTIAGGPSFVVF